MSNLNLLCQTVYQTAQIKEVIEANMVSQKEQQLAHLIRHRHQMTHHSYHANMQQQNELIVQLVAHFRDQNLYKYVGMIVYKIQTHAEKIIFMNGDLRLLKQNLGNQIATIEYAAKYIQNFPELLQLIQLLWSLFRVTTFFTPPYIVCPRMIELFNLSVVRDIYLSQFNQTHQLQLNIYHQYNSVPQRYDNFYLSDDDYSNLQTQQQQSSAIYSEYGYNQQPQPYQTDTQYQQQRDYSKQQISQPSYSNPYQSQTYNNYNVSVNYQYNTATSNPYSNQQTSYPQYTQQPPPVAQNFVQPPPIAQNFVQPPPVAPTSYQSNMPYPPTTNYQNYSGQPTYPNQVTSTPMPPPSQIQQPTYPLPPPQTTLYPQSNQQLQPPPQSTNYPQSTTPTYQQSNSQAPSYPSPTTQPPPYPQQTTQTPFYPSSTPQTPSYAQSTSQTYYSDYQPPTQQTAQTTTAAYGITNDQYQINTQVTSNQQITYNYNSTELCNQNNTQVISNQQIQYNQNQVQPNQQYPQNQNDTNQQKLNDQQQQNISASYTPYQQQQNNNIQQTPNSSGSISQSTQNSQISQATSIYIPPNKEQNMPPPPPPPINYAPMAPAQPPPPPPPPINYAPTTPTQPIIPPQQPYNLPVYPPQQTSVSQQINNIPPPSELFTQRSEIPQQESKDDKSLFEELVKSCLQTDKLTDSQGQPQLSKENKIRKDREIKGFKNHDEQALYILKCYIDGKYVQNKIDRTEEMKQLVKS